MKNVLLFHEKPVALYVTVSNLDHITFSEVKHFVTPPEGVGDQY